jgi:hypothetical protein
MTAVMAAVMTIVMGPAARDPWGLPELGGRRVPARCVINEELERHAASRHS